MGRLNTLLRYNSRHHLFWGRGQGLHLNPISYSVGGGQVTRSWHEPRWLWRLRQRWFAFAGRQKCGRRAEGWHGQTEEELPDTWDIGPDGNRTCSYCGSIHYDDLIAICRKALTDPRYGLDGTTKSYKIYVTQPNVRNASEGAIKFYMVHVPNEVPDEHQELYREVMRLSRERFEAKMAERFPRKEAS